MGGPAYFYVPRNDGMRYTVQARPLGGGGQCTQVWKHIDPGTELVTQNLVQGGDVMGKASRVLVGWNRLGWRHCTGHHCPTGIRRAVYQFTRS